MELAEIRKELPKGSIVGIAKRIGISYSTVANFFNGKRGTSYDIEILNTAAEIIKEHRELRNQTLQTLKSAMSVENELVTI